MNLLDSLHPQPASWLHNSNLSPIVSGYVQRLETLHYSARTIRGYVYCVAHFAYWLRNREVDVQDISESLIHGFLAEHLPHCSCPSPVQRSLHQSRTALRHLLRALPDSGFLVDRRITDPIDDQLELFDRHMLRTMGLASSTRSRRIKIIRSLLRLCVKDNVKAELTPTPESLRIFLAKELTRLSPASAGSITGAVRCFLKFLAFHGASVAHLLPVVVSPAHWRLAPLPQVLSRDEVKQLLDAFAPTLPSNRRGCAMVRCLIDLGLRVKEVTGLELDDIDWSAGTVRIRRGKCRRDDVLLRFAEQQLGKTCAAIELSDLKPEFIVSFLDHLEHDRGNSTRSRNVRLAAIHSFLKFAARRDFTNLKVIEQALAVPMKRFDRKMVGFLTREQLLAIIEAGQNVRAAYFKVRQARQQCDLPS